MWSSKKEEKYTLITLQENSISNKSVEKLHNLIVELNDNIVLDLKKLSSFNFNSFKDLQSIYEKQFSLNKSFVTANLSDEILDQAEDADIELNAVPTLNEAIDLLFMEEIEREL